jgi:hypothetical protein
MKSASAASASVASLDPARNLFAHRALSREIGRRGVDGHQASGEREPVNVLSFRNGEVGIVGSGVGHELPPGRVWRDCMEGPSPSPKDRNSRRLDKQCLLIEARIAPVQRL